MQVDSTCSVNEREAEIIALPEFVQLVVCVCVNMLESVAHVDLCDLHHDELPFPSFTV